MLLDVEVDVTVFGADAVRRLIDFKWDRFGYEEFVQDMALHLILVAAWQCVVMRESYTSGAFIPTASALEKGSAVCLCVVAGIALFSKPICLVPRRDRKSCGRSRLRMVTTRRLATATETLVAMIPAALLLGASEAPVNALAMVVLITLSARSCMKEVAEMKELLQGDVTKYFIWPEVVWNLADLGSLVLMIAVIVRVLFHWDRGLTTQLGAVATFFLWFRFIKYLSGIESAAKYVQMFLRGCITTCQVASSLELSDRRCGLQKSSTISVGS